MLSEIINEDKFVSIVRLKKSIFNLTFKFCSSYEKIYYIASALFISESKLLAFIDDYSTLAEHVRLIDKIDVFIPCSNNTIACAITEPKILGRIDEYCNENAKIIQAEGATELGLGISKLVLLNNLHLNLQSNGLQDEGAIALRISKLLLLKNLHLDLREN